MKLTGEKKVIYGVEFEVAECYDENTVIQYPEKNLLFENDVLCKSLVCNRLYINAGKSINAGEYVSTSMLVSPSMP